MQPGSQIPGFEVLSSILQSPALELARRNEVATGGRAGVTDPGYIGKSPATFQATACNF